MVNTLSRVVPTLEKTWASDGQDVRKLLGEAFEVLEEGQLDAAHVGEPIRRGTFWGSYARA